MIVEGATGSHGFLGGSGADDEDDEADNEWRMWLKIWKAAMVGAERMVEKSDFVVARGVDVSEEGSAGAAYDSVRG